MEISKIPLFKYVTHLQQKEENIELSWIQFHELVKNKKA